MLRPAKGYAAVESYVLHFIGDDDDDDDDFISIALFHVKHAQLR